MTYALVTGASKGIGKSIAEELARRGNNVLLVSRSENLLKQLADSLHQTYKVQTDYLVLDLASPDAAGAIYTWYKSKGYQLNILVNNAGYGVWGKFDALSSEKQNEMLQINMLTLVNLTHTFIPELKKLKQSYILNIASSAAYQAVPTLSLYAASKAFVLSFSRGIRIELKDAGVYVSCVCPGPTTTGFIARAGMNASIEKKAEAFSMTADAVARIAVQGMYKGRAEIIPGFINKITAAATSILPKALLEAIANNLYK